MHSRNPSYLTKNRLGIFIFQYRIPKLIRENNPHQKPLIRKSLQTRNKREALKLARKLAVIMEENNYQLTDWEDEIERDNELFRAGKPLFEELTRLNKDGDHIEMDHFFLSLTDFPEKALHYMIERNNSYLELFEKILKKGSEYDRVSFIQQIPTVFRENIDNYFELHQAQGKQINTIEKTSQYFDSQEDVKTIIDTIQNQHKAGLTPIPLSEAFELFIKEKKTNWKGDELANSYRQDQFKLFFELVGNIETDELKKKHSIQYKNAVLHIPSNRNKIKKYRNHTVQMLMDKDIPDEDKFSTGNIRKYLQRLSGFLQWLQQDNYAIADIHEPLQIPVKDDTSAHEEKNQYECGDLAKLFNSKDYRQGLHDSPFKFWIPLIALFTGARANEMCQLYLSDIYQHEETGLWVFDINENDSKQTRKSLKKSSHARLIPIHKQLISLGFIDFYESVNSRNKERLFPELPYKIKNKYGAKAERWFNDTYTNKNNCNITTPKTSFHSIRHTVITYLGNKLDMPPHKISMMVGQKPEGGITVDRYIKPIDLEERNKYLQKMNFNDCRDLDFAKIRAWKHHKFAKK